MNAEVSLARVEAGRLVRSPFALLPFAVIGFWVVQAKQPGSEPIGPYAVLIGFGAVLPAFVMMAITVMAVLRSRYNRTEPMLETMPLSRSQRTIGHGIATLAGGALGLVAMVATLIYLRPARVMGVMADTLPRGAEIPRPVVAQYLQGPVSIVLYCCLGVALARWLPTWLVILVLVIPTAAQFLIFGIWSGTTTNVATWLFPLATGIVNGQWVGCGSRDALCELPVSGFDSATPWWHLGYLIALAAWFVAIGVLRDRRDRAAWAFFGGTVGAVIAFALVQAAVYEQYEVL